MTAFYKEIFTTSDFDCKDTIKNTSTSQIELFSQENKDDWTDSQFNMLSKIVELCGAELSACKIHHFTNSSQLTSAFTNKTTNYILLFCEPELMKTIHFNQKRIGFSEIHETKIYYNPTLSLLEQDPDAKKRLWNAMKQEFSL